MNYIFIFSLLAVGLSGIFAQVLLLRELMVSFYGNELTIGLILSNWLLAEACGVLIIGRVISGIRQKINLFVVLEITFVLTLPIALYLSRVFKPLLGVSPGETIGLPLIFISSLSLILLPASCHGALFGCCSAMSTAYFKDQRRSIGWVYAAETLGTLTGALCLTYFFLPRLNLSQIALGVSVLNLFVCLAYLKDLSRVLKYILAGVFLIIFCFLYFFGAGRLEKISISGQWPGREVVSTRNSVYGNIALIKEKEQYTLFYNGLPLITAPYPDINFIQDFANFPLLFCAHPEEVLVLGNGAGGMISQILRYPVRNIDYAELDPLLIEMLADCPAPITREELSDKRVSLANSDARLYLRTAKNKYDLILIGLSRPSDLSINRLFTREFFLLARDKLKTDGILAFSLPGSFTYLSRELRDLNACILNALIESGWQVAVVPGDYNIFIASMSPEAIKADPEAIIQKIRQYRVDPGIFLPGYIKYRLDKNIRAWWEKSLSGATLKVNRDFSPFAVFQMLVIWNKQFSPFFATLLEKTGDLNLGAAFWIIGIIGLAGLLVMRRRPGLTLAYSIATSGFFAMLANLVLVFGFQVVYGYLYHSIGLLIAVFMSGIAAASILVTCIGGRLKNSLNLFIRLELAIILFCPLMAGLIKWSAAYPDSAAVVFIMLFFVAGAFPGAQFALAARMRLDSGQEPGRAASLLYFFDLAGGCLAGILGGVALLPVFGLADSCLIAAALKTSSLVLLLIFAKRLTKALI